MHLLVKKHLTDVDRDTSTLRSHGSTLCHFGNSEQGKVPEVRTCSGLQQNVSASSLRIEPTAPIVPLHAFLRLNEDTA